MLETNRTHSISLDGSIPIPISKRDYKRVINVIGVSNIKRTISLYKEICNLLQITGITNLSHIDYIARILSRNKDINSVISYLKNREKNGIDLYELVDFGNYIEAFNIMGFDSDIVRELFNLTFNGRSIMGKGEILINTLVKNAVKPVQSGDITINSVKYDVKIEKARFKGQKGFNSSVTVSNYLEKYLKCFTCTHNIPPGGTNSYHPTTKTAGVYFEITRSLIESGYMSVEEAVNGYKNALLQAYTKIDLKYLTFVDDFYKSYDERVIIKGLPLSLTRYYLDIEQLIEGGVICLSASGKIRLLRSDNLQSFNLRSPSFSSNASNQGSAAMIYSI